MIRRTASGGFRYSSPPVTATAQTPSMDPIFPFFTSLCRHRPITPSGYAGETRAPLGALAGSALLCSPCSCSVKSARDDPSSSPLGRPETKQSLWLRVWSIHYNLSHMSRVFCRNWKVRTDLSWRSQLDSGRFCMNVCPWYSESLLFRFIANWHPISRSRPNEVPRCRSEC